MKSKTTFLNLPAFAKVNLDLRVIGKREDGFHEIETVFQLISLSDSLRFQLVPKGECLIVTGIPVPDDSSNLVLKAAQLISVMRTNGLGIKITLDKRIPVGAGLGGGSSNAAVTLMALNRLWKCGCDRKRLTQLAGQLGSDVSFFLTGGTAIGTGKGEIIHPMDDVSPQNLWIINPGFPVATSEIYRALNLTPVDLLTTRDVDTTIRRFQKRWTQNIWPDLVNDLETVAFSRYPILEEMKMALIDAGFEFVMLSGSGSSFFVLSDQNELERRLKETKLFESAVLLPCRTVSRTEYKKAVLDLCGDSA